MGDDVAAIVQMVNLYGLAVDTQRWDLFDRIFTSDARVDFGGPAVWSDRTALQRDFAAYHAPFDGTQHAMSGHLVTVTDDTAAAFCYGNWRLIRRGMAGGDLWEGTGWYDDTLVRDDGGWRISARTCRLMYWHGNPQVNEPVPGVRFEAAFESLPAHARAGDIGFLAGWPTP